MEKVILMMALVGCGASSSFAQGDAYICTEKIVRSHEIPVTEVVPTTGKFTYYSHDTEIRNIVLGPEGAFVPTAAPAEPCYQYTENNMKVTKCADITYKNDGKNVYEYSTTDAYLGFYPADHPGTAANNTAANVQENDYYTEDKLLNCTKAKAVPAPATHQATNEWGSGK